MPIYHRIASANQKAARNWRAKYQPISVQRGTGARMSANQSAERNPRAKYQPIRGLLGTRANANQSERLQEPRECRPIRALAGTAAQGLEHLQNEGHKY